MWITWDLSCDETLPLPTLDESDESADIPMSMQKDTQTSTVPRLNFELIFSWRSFYHRRSYSAHLGLNGEPSSNYSLSTLRQGFILGSPPFTSLNTHIRPLAIKHALLQLMWEPMKRYRMKRLPRQASLSW